ncbi:hypothetical protein [Halarchaeum sp. P4]|uniref:hypothetical protein n=1 Tax=Halarchaeum sp. P4 TaxID=3421639 RepID=UPI003EBDC87D
MPFRRTRRSVLASLGTLVSVGCLGVSPRRRTGSVFIDNRDVTAHTVRVVVLDGPEKVGEKRTVTVKPGSQRTMSRYFVAAGVYRVRVVLDDGASTATATLTVRSDSPGEYLRATIEGGGITLDVRHAE